jgi:hypothetical protein
MKFLLVRPSIPLSCTRAHILQAFGAVLKNPAVCVGENILKDIFSVYLLFSLGREVYFAELVIWRNHITFEFYSFYSKRFCWDPFVHCIKGPNFLEVDIGKSV